MANGWKEGREKESVTCRGRKGRERERESNVTMATKASQHIKQHPSIMPSVPPLQHAWGLQQHTPTPPPHPARNHTNHHILSAPFTLLSLVLTHNHSHHHHHHPEARTQWLSSTDGNEPFKLWPLLSPSLSLLFFTLLCQQPLFFPLPLLFAPECWQSVGFTFYSLPLHADFFV